MAKGRAKWRSEEARAFDPITMEVFSNRLVSIAEDMGTILIRSSFSSNIKERRDCSTGLFDGRGRLLAQAAHIPLHLGSLFGGVEAVLRACPVARMKEGDAFVCNDCYLAGGTHTPDITVVTPVFWDGAVRFFTANIGHHADVGGSVPGSVSHDAKTVFEEGLRIPVMRIVRAGEIDDELLAMIAHNTREPDDRMLDLRVQIATNQRGAGMVHELVRQMGMDAVERSIEDILGYTRRRLRRRIAELKDGEYGFTAYLDHDGLGGEPVPLCATVRVAGEDLMIDFTGSGAQSRGAANIAASALNATCYYAVKAMLDPELMPNSGMFEAIRIFAPEGTITNPRFPAAVGARANTCQKLAGAIVGAFRGLLPKEKVMASSNDVMAAMVFSGETARRARTYVYVETIGGGAGAGHHQDGMDGVHVHTTNTSNLPAEALEHEYPLLVDEYALVPDSGGAGRHRGGVGIARQIQARTDGTICIARSDSHVTAAAGAFGGLDGGRARVIHNHGRPDARIMPSKVGHLVLGKGESMRLETPGGGGFGPPGERLLAGLAADLRSGLVTPAAAARDYGAERVQEALALAESPRQGKAS